ncbi:hypothetical protein PENSPDRAFT_740280 [Peniophora sp. CONT]|nr:hypothetical protein PENSPDRAFT_740280 [Peniophora sp. CONT]
MMSSANHRQGLEPAMDEADPSSIEWITVASTSSEPEDGVEDERDELIDDDDSDVRILSHPSALTIQPSPVTSGDATRSRVLAPQTRTATHNSHTTTTGDIETTTSHVAESSSHALKKRRRRNSPEVEGSSHRPVKQLRSRAPSPPSFPASQADSASELLPLSVLGKTSTHRTNASLHEPAISGISTSGRGPASRTPNVIVSTTPSPHKVPRTFGEEPSYGPVDLELIERGAALLARAFERSKASARGDVVSKESISNSESAEKTSFATNAGAVAAMHIDGLMHDDETRNCTPQIPTPNASRASLPPQRRCSASRGTEVQLSSRAFEHFDEPEDIEYHVRRSRMILRSVEAGERVNGLSRVHSADIPIIWPDSLGACTVIAHVPGVEKWVSEVTRTYGLGSETHGDTKSKPQQKRRARGAHSNSDAASFAHSETTSVRAMLENAFHSMEVDVPAISDDISDEDLQRQANEWAALIRNVVKGKSTRQRNPEALLKALCGASNAHLSSLMLARSGLHAAVRALGEQMGEQARAGEMMAAIDAARTLADVWEKQYGAGALEEEL